MDTDFMTEKRKKRKRRVELHACDIEQAFLQADKLPEGVNGRYFIQPPPGSPDANNRDVVYEVCRPLYVNPS